MHREAVPKLVRTDTNGHAGVDTASTGPREDRFPGVGLNNLANLGQPQSSGLLRRPVIRADHEPTSLVGGQRIDEDGAAGAERYPERVGARSTNQDQPFD